MVGIEKQDHDPGVEQQLQANRLVKEPGMASDKRSLRDIPTRVPTSPHQIAASPIKKTADVRARLCRAAAGKPSSRLIDPREAA